MDKLFWGLLLVLLDWPVSIGSAILSLLPDFLGYWLIYQGCTRFTEESRHFLRAKSLAAVLAGYTGILFVLDLFGVHTNFALLSLVLDGIRIAGSLFSGYWLIRGIRQMELLRAWDLAAVSLQTMWKFLSVMQLLCFALSWIPLIGMLASLAGTIVSICFLAAFYKSCRLFTKNHSPAK